MVLVTSIFFFIFSSLLGVTQSRSSEPLIRASGPQSLSLEPLVRSGMKNERIAVNADGTWAEDVPHTNSRPSSKHIRTHAMVVSADGKLSDESAVPECMEGYKIKSADCTGNTWLDKNVDNYWQGCADGCAALAGYGYFQSNSGGACRCCTAVAGYTAATTQVSGAVNCQIASAAAPTVEPPTPDPTPTPSRSPTSEPTPTPSRTPTSEPTPPPSHSPTDKPPTSGPACLEGYKILTADCSGNTWLTKDAALYWEGCAAGCAALTGYGYFQANTAGACRCCTAVAQYTVGVAGQVSGDVTCQITPTPVPTVEPPTPPPTATPPNFYSLAYSEPGATWTQAEADAVLNQLWSTFEAVKQDQDATENVSAPKLLRLAFHDCMKNENLEGGCDGCLDWTDMDFRFDEQRMRYYETETGERAFRTSNAGLQPTVEYLEGIYTDVLGGTSGGKSRADLWAFASMAAVEYGIAKNNKVCEQGNGGGYCLQMAHALNRNDSCNLTSPVFAFKTGRRDCCADHSSYKLDECQSGLRDNQPSHQANGPDTVDWFKVNFNFSGSETVAIMGAHTFGQFEPKVSLFHYVWTPRAESLINNQYYRNLMAVDDWRFDDDTCVPVGDAEGNRPKAFWKAKATAQRRNYGPIQWILYKYVCPNCQVDETVQNIFRNDKNPVTGNLRYEECCDAASIPSGYFCADIDGCVTARFINVRDEAALPTDIGLYYDFSVNSSSGFPYGCSGLDAAPFTPETYCGDCQDACEAASDCSRKQVEANCSKQTYIQADDSKALSEYVEDYANDNQGWINAFYPAVEKMVQNGYGAADLVDGPAVDISGKVVAVPLQYTPYIQDAE